MLQFCVIDVGETSVSWPANGDSAHEFMLRFSCCMTTWQSLLLRTCAHVCEVGTPINDQWDVYNLPHGFNVRFSLGGVFFIFFSHCLARVELRPSPRCLQAVCVVWCVGNNPLNYSAVAGNWTRATGRTDSKIHPFSHWAIVTDWMVYLYKNNFYPMESKHLAWQYILLQSNSLQWVINSMNMPMMVIQTTGSKASVMMQVICPLKWASTELKKKLIWNQNIL